MVLKIKLLAALAAVTGMECAGPMRPAATAEETGVSQQALSLPALPPLPPIQTTRTWEPGMRTGLQVSTATTAHLVLMKDPFTTGRVLAYGFDPSTQTNLFVFAMTLSQAAAFQQQWVIDVEAWRAYGSSGIKTDSTTDGIGGGTPVPAPRPGFTEQHGWKHAFYAWQMQSQIDHEAGYP
jgi:hypothetical protein